MNQAVVPAWGRSYVPTYTRAELLDLENRLNSLASLEYFDIMVISKLFDHAEYHYIRDAMLLKGAERCAFLNEELSYVAVLSYRPERGTSSTMSHSLRTMDAPQFTYDPERGIEAVQPTAVLAVLQEVHFKEDAYLVGISRWRQRVIFAERLPFSAGLYLSGSGTFEIKWNKPAISSEATW